jgi:AAA domain/Primase C terminal 1 (PriCT-1)/RepB DNA-primase from phage plasmid
VTLVLVARENDPAVAQCPSASKLRNFLYSIEKRRKNFLRYLDPVTNDFTFQTFTDSEERRKAFTIDPRTNKRFDPLARTLHGTLTQYWATLADLSRQGAGVFVTINRTILHKPRIAENITEIRAYFVDFDETHPNVIKINLQRFGLTPHVINQTSEGRWHFYWFVDGGSLAEFGPTQEKLSELLGSDASVKDLPRVMRLPGFIHQKDNDKISVTKIVHTHDGRNYANAGFQRALAAALARLEGRRSLTSAALSGLPKSPPDWSEGYAEGQRNNECARRAGSCLARGMTEEETLAECLRWNQKNTPPLPDNEVKATVASVARTEERKKGAHAAFPDGQLPMPSSNFVFDGDATIEPPKMLVKKLLPASGIAFIGGQSGAGKTFIAIALGVALAAGSEFFKYKVLEPVGVAYIAAEGAGMFAARVAAAKLAAEVKQLLPFAWTDKVPTLQTQEGLALFVKQLQGLKQQMFQRTRVRLGAIFIDTVATCFSMKDENANAEVSGVCHLMRQIGESVGVVVIPVHHYGKDPATGLRGASAWRGAADVVVSVTADIDALTGRVSSREIAIAKARDEEQGPVAPFLLEWVKLGTDEHGDDFGTCIVKPDLARGIRQLAPSNAPKGVRVFNDACRFELGEHSEDVQLAKDSPRIRAVELKYVKAKFCNMYVTGEADPKKAYETIGRAWRRVLEKLPAEYAIGKGQDGREWVWLKTPSSLG